MALVKSLLATQIKTALDKQSDKNVDPETAREELANDIATAIDAFVKSGVVNTMVVGTSPSGAVTGTGTGAIT